ncbi:MAG: S-layer homology domain-containing protein [Lysinibacillus sp.]
MKFLRFMMAIMLALSFALPASAMTGNNNEPAHYLALGDSLAAGVNENNQIVKGYTGELAEWLEKDGLLASYNRSFAIPGYKTNDILEDLEKNVERRATGTLENVKILDAIKQADVITLTIGANDVLSGVKFNPDGTITFNEEEIAGLIKKATQNIDEILKTIKEVNPTADVFVMGLYNPKPQLLHDKPLLDYFVNQVDLAIQKVTVNNVYYFIPVKHIIEAKSDEYLPNPLNIHPSEAGYQAIAEEFYGPVKSYIQLTPEPGVIDPEPTPEPTPEPLPDFKDVKPTDSSYEYIMTAVEKGILKGYSNGTFRPNNKVTRAQVTSMMTRMLALTDETKKAPYTDISKLAEKTQQEIVLAYNAGLLKQGKKFGATEALSRLEFAQMADKAYTYATGEVYKPKKTASFTDISKLSAEQKRVITLLYDLKVATGVKGKFNPNGKVTRSQAAKMMVLLSEELK